MTQVKKHRLSLKYKPFNISTEARYCYSYIIKYENIRSKGFTEQEALEFLELKRSTFYSWLKKFNDKYIYYYPCNHNKSEQAKLEHSFRTLATTLNILTQSKIACMLEFCIRPTKFKIFIFR